MVRKRNNLNNFIGRHTITKNWHDVGNANFKPGIQTSNGLSFFFSLLSSHPGIDRFNVEMVLLPPSAAMSIS